MFLPKRKAASKGSQSPCVYLLLVGKGGDVLLLAAPHSINILPRFLPPIAE